MIPAVAIVVKLDGLTNLPVEVKYCHQQPGKSKGGEAMADTFEDIKKVIVDLLGVEPEKVTREARFREDLGADSLDLVEMIMEFEERFGQTISDEDAQQLRTVGNVVDYVEQHKAGA
jgi:acyl carrier protein